MKRISRFYRNKMDEDNFENDEEYGDVMEQKAFERAGPMGKLSELLSVSYDPSNPKKGTLSPEDRFLIAVDALSRKISEESRLKLSQEDINDMLERSRTLKNMRYKNPAAYILGYLASKGGSRLDVRDFQEVVEEVLPLVSATNGVEPADVLRYARMWRGL